ncbi:MAG: hypothetical protein IKX70_00780 [Treponema sp.]|nr:hypothetical protein [Treponema sp.]
MKTIKKLFMVTVIAFTAFTAFSQTSVPTSNTSDATNELFYTDVDKFLNVNEWSTVNPEKAFVMFDTNGARYDIGFAKNFSKCYWGSFFSGDFGSYTKYVTKTESSTSYEEHNGGPDTNHSIGSNDQTSFYFTNLFGFGDIGFRAAFYYYSGVDSNKTDNGTTVTANDRNRWSIYTTTGWKSATLGKFVVKPYIIANFLYNSNGGLQTTTASKVTNDTRNWRLDFGVGGSTVLSKDELKESTLSTSLTMQFTNPVDKDYSKAKTTYFALPVEYKIVFTPAEKFSFGFRARLNNTLNIADDDPTKTTTFTVTPSLYSGFQYDTMKKVVLNAGVSFAVPRFQLTETKNSNTKITTTTYNWNGTDGSITFNSGLQINPVKNLCIDCSCSFIADIMGNGDMSSNLSTVAGTSIWETANQLLVHNITIQLSYKF